MNGMNIEDLGRMRDVARAQARREAVASAEAELNNVGLPSIRELLILVKRAANNLEVKGLNNQDRILVERCQQVVRMYDGICEGPLS